MRSIIYNSEHYCNTNNLDVQENLLHLYNTYLKNDNIEEDVAKVIEFIITYYKSCKSFPSSDIIKENFKDFQLIEKVYSSEGQYLTVIKDKLKILRENYRQKLALKYLEKDIPIETRMSILDEITKIETSNILTQSVSIKEASDYNMREIIERRKNLSQGIKTGIPEVDELTQGIAAGKILTLIAPPGSFKTTFAINMAYLELMEQENSNILFITLEIPVEEMLIKMGVVRHSFSKNIQNMSYLKISKSKYLTESDETKVYDITDDFNSKKKSKIYFMTSETLIADSLVAMKNQILDFITKNEIKTVYLDYIQLVMDMKPKGYIDGRDWGNAVFGMLRYISVTSNCRFIILSQANAEGIAKAERNGGKFSMTNISEINTIKNHSYYIMSLYADDELKISKQVKWQLIKFRDGETKVDPTITFVEPANYAMGDLSSYINFDNISDKLLEESSEGTTSSLIDLFS